MCQHPVEVGSSEKTRACFRWAEGLASAMQATPWGRGESGGVLGLGLVGSGARGGKAELS